MINKEFVVTSKNGLHARPAALLVKTVGKFKSDVMISKDGYEVNGKSIMGVMTLAAESGSTLVVMINGEDEKQTCEALEELFENKFFEE